MAAARSIPPIPTTTSGRPGAKNGADSTALVPAAPRPQSLEAKIGRRDTPPARRTPLSSPPPAGRASEPLRPMPIAPTNERNVRQAKAGARSEPSPALPTAQVPWSEPESIENEIVRALRFDPQTRGGPTGNRQEPSSARPTVDPATTLGDLADKLEEALAREVQAAGQPRHPGSDVEDFGFENAAPAAENERAKPSTQKDRQEKRERSESVRNAKPAPAPEPEPRHEPSPTPERREEAPVISLSSRRRESADQLEDEMARLLGELTSDTKGR
jgi:hypothetical protein